MRELSAIFFVWQDLAILATFDPGATDWVVIGLILFFSFAVGRFIVVFFRATRTVRRHIAAPKASLQEVLQIAEGVEKPLPFLVVLVPAKNESAVIFNTLTRLAELEYPKDRYAAVIITDAREGKIDSGQTTLEIASQYAESLNADRAEPLVYVFDVPEWYSGRFRDEERTFAASTKGRALNYALDLICKHGRLSQADMLGVLDADGRMHKSVLCEVASRRLSENAELLQGPVFQVSNFDRVGLVGKAAGIELSIYHLSTLANQLLSGRATARFLAGTNYFIDTQLLIGVGGWNEHALVEDAELGLRVFLRKGVSPGWLPCQEIEQTSPNRRIYLRQRQRWSLGHFQLLPMIAESNLSWRVKMALRGKILGATLMTPIDSGMPILGWIALVIGWTAAAPVPLHWIMIALTIGSMFVWDFFGRGARLLAPYGPIADSRQALILLRLKLIGVMPWMMLLQAQPRIVAFYKYLAHDRPHEWEKTPRTVEQILASQETRVEAIGSQSEPAMKNR